VFYKDSHEVYRVPELDALPWLVHGFGSKAADIPALFDSLATLKQIHSSECVFAEGRKGQLGEGDALLENTPGAMVAVKTADCIPVLLVDEKHRAVAAVHAGWRGTVAGIVGRAITAMAQRFGTSPSGLYAAVGPGVGECCYEVGPEVARHFGREGKAHIDLAADNGRQLREAGVTPVRIFTAGLCTMCTPGEFHSYRRDRELAGRMFSFVGLRPAEE
jgi:hypothetical protein